MEQKRQYGLIVLLVIVLLFYHQLYAQNIGINVTGATPDPSAMLDIDVAGTEPRGLLVPRITTTERDNIAQPIPESLLIFNTTTRCFEAWNQDIMAWVSFGCIDCEFPGEFTAITDTITATPTSFTAGWTNSAGATSYFLDVSTDINFSSVVSGYDNINIGNTNTYDITDLTCNTIYYYRIISKNACGTDTSNTVMQVAIPCGPTCGTQIWMSANVNIGLMKPIDWENLSLNPQNNDMVVEKYCWNDLESNCDLYGGWYTWTEAMQIPFIYYNSDYPVDYDCDPCGSDGVQGICPPGYHIPTDLEWSRYEYCIESSMTPIGPTTLVTFQVTSGWRGSTIAGAAPGAKLKATYGNTPAWDGLNVSGFSAVPAGVFTEGFANNEVGTTAYYWTATESGDSNAFVRELNTGEDRSYRAGFKKNKAISVRCLKD